MEPGLSGVAAERAARIAAMVQAGMADAAGSYDVRRHLVGRMGADGRTMTYFCGGSLAYALGLLREGGDANRTRAAEIVAAVCSLQVTDPGHPHHGNWPWLAGDAEIVDLNAVQFVLRGLLPILVGHAADLPQSLRVQCRNTLRLALEEEARLDVAPTYTNIHLMSLLALLVGGEWLGDERYARLGRQRWQRWVDLTATSGNVHEYNSPGYGAIDLLALASIASLVRDDRVRWQARLAYERLLVSFALRLHAASGQMAGPHCRCYWPMMTSGQSPIKVLLWRELGWDWLLSGGPRGYATPEAPDVPVNLDVAQASLWLPTWIEPLLGQVSTSGAYAVRETANRAAGHHLCTYLTPSYALGTASRTYGIGTDCYYIEHQANHLLLHYARPKAANGWGMVYTRYVVNDRHWGALGAAPDRSKEANFYDGGSFAGAQLRNKAIALYALRRESEEVHALKTVVSFPKAETLDGIWVSGERVDVTCLPRPAAVGDWLVVADGGVYVGCHVLDRSRLGFDAPIRLERGPVGELWLTIHNYLGPPKRFWDYASLGGAFWRGNVRAGVVFEVAERGEYPSPAAFYRHLSEGVVTDEVDDRDVRTVSYRSGDESVTLEYDLWRSERVGERHNGVAHDPLALSSPWAAQGADGLLAVGRARLLTRAQPMWLVAVEGTTTGDRWVAANPLGRPTALRWETPAGTIRASRWGLGFLEWRRDASGASRLVVRGPELPTDLVVPEGVSVVREAEGSIEAPAAASSQS